MSFDCRQALETLTEQLAALPIEVHLADDPVLIERCSLFLTNALQFWHEHRAKIPSVDALTVILLFSPPTRAARLNPELRAWNDHVVLLQSNTISRRGGSASTWINWADLAPSYSLSPSTAVQCSLYA